MRVYRSGQRRSCSLARPTLRPWPCGSKPEMKVMRTGLKPPAFEQIADRCGDAGLVSRGRPLRCAGEV